MEEKANCKECGSFIEIKDLDSLKFRLNGAIERREPIILSYDEAASALELIENMEDEIEGNNIDDLERELEDKRCQLPSN